MRSIRPAWSVRAVLLAVIACATIAMTAVAATGVADAQEAPAPTRSLDDLKARCLEAIEARLVTLDRLDSAIATSTALTDSHAATLGSIVDGAVARLEALVPQIAAAATPEELRPLCTSVVVDNRIYLLVAPQVHLTIALDQVDLAVGVATDAIARLDAAITDAAAGGADVTEAQAHRDMAASAVDSAAVAVAGHADAVVALTPADWNAGTAGPVLDAARAAARSGRSQLGTARAEIAAAVAALTAA